MRWGRGPEWSLDREEKGASRLFKADTDGFASPVVSVSCLSLGMHPNLHGEMKTLKDWWVESWNADKGKFHHIST